MAKRGRRKDPFDQDDPRAPVFTTSARALATSEAKMVDLDGLTRQDRAFALAYIACGSATQAAETAGGYREGVKLAALGQRLIKRPAVRAFITRRTDEKLRLAELSIDWVLERYRRLADSDVRRLYRPDGTFRPLHELDDDTAATIASVEVEVSVKVAEPSEADPGGSTTTTTTYKVKRWDPIRPLDSLAKWFRMFNDDRPPLPDAAAAQVTITTADPVEAAEAYRRLVDGAP